MYKCVLVDEGAYFSGRPNKASCLACSKLEVLYHRRS